MHVNTQVLRICSQTHQGYNHYSQSGMWEFIRLEWGKQKSVCG